MPDPQSSPSPVGNPLLSGLEFSALTLEQRLSALEAGGRQQQEAEASGDLVTEVKRGEWALISINGLTLIATLIIALIYYHQLNAMRDSNAVNRESLESVQRAFVVPAPSVNLVTDAKGQPIVYNVTAHWINSGVTPTRDLTEHVSHTNMHVLPGNFDFPELWQGGVPRKDPLTFIGPKADVNSGDDFSLTPEILEELFDQHQRVYIWGMVKYRDIFPETKRHITEFCTSIFPIPDNSNRLRLTSEECDRHNCSDEECSDYDAEISKP